MKTRLNIEYRRSIKEMVLSHKFDPLKRQLAREASGLAEECYNVLYSEPTRKKMEELEATLKGSFAQQNYLKVNAAGWQLSLLFGAAQAADEDYKTKLFAYTHYCGYDPVVILSEDSELGRRVRDFGEREKAMKDERKLLSGSVQAKLDAYATFDRLVEAWPEIERFARAVELGISPGSTMPAVIDNSALNAALDLPPEDLEPTDAIAQPKK